MIQLRQDTTMRFVCTTVLGLAIFGITSRCDGDNVLPSIPHDRWDVIPFGERSGAGNYQQVYDVSMFDAPILIEGLAFSVAKSTTFTADITIRLGYTAVEVDEMSIPLDSNITSPLTTVYVDSSYSKPVAAGSELFDLDFLFASSPFLFDPSLGKNLLLDVTIDGKSDGSGIEEQGVSMIPSVPNDLTGRAYDMTGFVGVNPWGARTKFKIAAVVPEPSSILTFAGLALCFGLARRWRTRRKQAAVTTLGAPR
jgi:hypothetical protein